VHHDELKLDDAIEPDHKDHEEDHPPQRHEEEDKKRDPPRRRERDYKEREDVEDYRPPSRRERDHDENLQERSYVRSEPKDYSEYRPQKEKFEYDTYVDLAGEGASFATAAQLVALEKRNKVLMEAIEKLEDKLYDMEDQRMAVQRKLLIAEEESADYRTLIDQRESLNVQIRKELDQLGVKLQNETSRFNEVDNERCKLEHKAALLQGEVDVNARAQAKLEQTLAEIENLRQKLTSMINEKGELDQVTCRYHFGRSKSIRF